MLKSMFSIGKKLDNYLELSYSSALELQFLRLGENYQNNNDKIIEELLRVKHEEKSNITHCYQHARFGWLRIAKQQRPARGI